MEITLKNYNNEDEIFILIKENKDFEVVDNIGRFSEKQNGFHIDIPACGFIPLSLWHKIEKFQDESLSFIENVNIFGTTIHEFNLIIGVDTNFNTIERKSITIARKKIWIKS